ncbi:hypothetical protein SDC9_176767 [bioreactor metagenome]|uniref:Uncharacterized protein n=1 Tax=bioreactor metagenome TaxID=1076179 RepID=A0A645GRF5_9ZZZZ
MQLRNVAHVGYDKFDVSGIVEYGRTCYDGALVRYEGLLHRYRLLR